MSELTNGGPQSPLSADEIHRLDATLLPALERHHLRLLAHALRTLQQVQRVTAVPGLPDPAAIAAWLRTQPELGGEAAFVALLSEQLSKAGEQLEHLARQRGQSALSLALEDLIDWARAQADRRLTNAPPDSPPTPPAAPPANP